MGLKLAPKVGDTALQEEDLDQIIPKHITNRTQLDEVEQYNIEEAYLWLHTLKSIKPEKLFSEAFQDLVHKKMFGNVWKWAGKQRTTETNIGIMPSQIAIERKKLNEDAWYWIEHNTWPPIETALRFHHRLVQIHCYPNGNGRHARIMADIILEKIYKVKPLPWVYSNLIHPHNERNDYISALKAADQGDYSLLLKCGGASLK